MRLFTVFAMAVLCGCAITPERAMTAAGVAIVVGIAVSASSGERTRTGLQPQPTCPVLVGRESATDSPSVRAPFHATFAQVSVPDAASWITRKYRVPGLTSNT